MSHFARGRKMSADTALMRYTTDGQPQEVPCTALGRQIIAATSLGSSLQLSNGVFDVALARSRDFAFVARNVNMNALGDVAVFTGFPARWRLGELYLAEASQAAPLLSRFGIFTGAGGTGTAIVPSRDILLNLTTNLSLAVNVDDTSGVFTSTSVYLRCTRAAGAPYTCSFFLSFQDWS